MYKQPAVYTVCFTIDWEEKKRCKMYHQKFFHHPHSYVNGKYFSVLVLSLFTECAGFAFSSYPKWLLTISLIRGELR